MPDEPTTKTAPNKGPRLDMGMVQTFVGAAHGDIAAVEVMLAQEPRLINATWDWGGGDFETALGGAAHMGRPDIARLLLSRGARLDLFAAAMLGKLEIVKATLIAFPEALNTKGPHGIPLLVHAQKGGRDAEQVLRYLESIQGRDKP